MDEEREVAKIAFALIDRASDLCAAVHRRLAALGIVDPRPRHYALALLELNDDRRHLFGGYFDGTLLAQTFGYLVPMDER